MPAEPLIVHDLDVEGPAKKRQLAPGAIPYLWAALLTLVFYAPRFWQGARLAMGDYWSYYVPVRIYATQALRSGRIPHWCVELFGGYPFLSDPQAAVWYPPNLLLTLLTANPGRSAVMDAFVIGHIVLLALGGVFLARAFGIGAAGAVVTSLVIAHNGYVINHLGHTSITETNVMGVWALGAVARAVLHSRLRWSIAAGLLFGSAMLAGHPQTVFLLFAAGGLGVAILALDRGIQRRRLRAWAVPFAWFALAVAVAVLASMIQFLPTRKLLAVTPRAQLQLHEAMLYSAPIGQWPGLFFPNLYSPLTWLAPLEHRAVTALPGWPRFGAWESLLHMGFVAFALGLFGWLAYVRRLPVQFLFWGGVVAWLLSTGPDAGLYPLLYKFAPGFKQMRVPPRLLFPAFIGWALLAGLGVDAISRVEARTRRRAAHGAALLIGSAGAVAAVVYAITWSRLGSWKNAHVKLFMEDPAVLQSKYWAILAFDTNARQQLLIIAITVTFCMVWMFLTARQHGPRRGLRAVAVGALFLELAIYGMHKNIAIGMPEFQFADAPLLRAFPSNPPGRVTGFETLPEDMMNGALQTGLEYTGGLNPMRLTWAAAFMPEENPSLTKLMTLWDVSHVAVMNRSVPVQVGEQKTSIDVLGWMELARQTASCPETILWDVPSSVTASRVHLIAALANSGHLPTDTVVGRVELFSSNGVLKQTFPLRAGREVADWRADDPSAAIVHAKVPVAARVPMKIPALYSAGAFNMASLETSASAGFDRVRVVAMAEPPVRLLVTQLLLERDGVLESRAALETQGYTNEPSGDREWRMLGWPGRLGRTWMVPEARFAPHRGDFEEAKRAVVDESFVPDRHVVVASQKVSKRPIGELNSPDPSVFFARAAVESADAPERFLVRTESNQQGWLVVSRAFYPGWTATIDGKEAKVVQANGAHMAVAVDRGRHAVRFRFRTPKFREGALISGVTWVVALAVLAWPRGRRRVMDARQPALDAAV